MNAFLTNAVDGQRRVQLALTPSSPFRMVLSRTRAALESRALRLVEQTAATHILDSFRLSMVENEHHDLIKDVEVVIQTSEFQDDLETTRIKFFALATFAEATDSEMTPLNSTQLQDLLDSVISLAFSTQENNILFLQLLLDNVIEDNNVDNSEQLLEVNNVAVASPAPGPSPAPGGVDNDARTVISALDKTLIAVSSCILIGIVWMIFLYYRDLGYFATDPDHEVLNSTMGSFPNDAGSFPVALYDEVVDLTVPPVSVNFIVQHVVTSEEPIQDAGSIDQAFNKICNPLSDFLHARYDDIATKTPNTSYEIFNKFSSRAFEVDAHEYGSDSDGQITAVQSLEQSQLADLHLDSDVTRADKKVPPSSSSEDIKLLQPFDTNVFRTALSRNDSSFNAINDCVPTTNSGSDSDDLFQIDVAAGESITADSASRRSSSQEIIDWMKSVHVVILSGDRSTSVMTISTEGHISDDMSSGRTGSAKSELESDLHEVGSLGHTSLEQSMASSTPAGEAQHDTGIPFI